MSVLAAPRRLALASWLSYRALFTWLNPVGYVSSRVVSPIALTLLFSMLAIDTGRAVARPLLGGALLAVAGATLFGLSLAVNNDRMFGTFAVTLATPQGMAVNLAGKAAPHLLDGVLGAVLTFTAASLVLGVAPPAAALGPLVAAAAATAVSTSGLALAAASIALRFRDTFTAPNVAMVVLLVFSGALVAPADLPLSAPWVTAALPVGRATEFGLATTAGQAPPWALLGWELAVGAAWFVLGYGLLGAFLARARKAGTLDFF